MALTPRWHPAPGRTAIVLALSAMLSAASAAGQPVISTAAVEPSPEAQFAEARAALDARRWRDAVGRFEALHRRWRHPSVDYNLGMALRGLGHPARAGDHLRAYLASLPPDAPRRGPLERTIESLADGSARVRIERDPPEADVLIDGVTYGREVEELALSAGPHEFAARAEGHLAIARIEVVAIGDARRTIALRLNPVAASPAPVVVSPRPVVVPPRPLASPPMSRVANWLGPSLLLGVTVIGVGAATAFYVLREEALISCGPVDQNGARPCLDGPFDHAITYNTVTNVSLGVTGLAALGGALWVILARPWRHHATATGMVQLRLATLGVGVAF